MLLFPDNGLDGLPHGQLWWCGERESEAVVATVVAAGTELPGVGQRLPRECLRVRTDSESECLVLSSRRALSLCSILLDFVNLCLLLLLLGLVAAWRLRVESREAASPSPPQWPEDCALYVLRGLLDIVVVVVVGIFVPAKLAQV